MAITGFLTLSGLFIYSKQVIKGQDAKRKSDLNRIKAAFTDYYNDHGCFPPADSLEKYCNGENINILDNYLKPVPCDPKTKKAYLYRPYPDNSRTCQGFRVLTTLENIHDKDIKRLHCDFDDGCGAGSGFEKYNYGVSEGVPVSYHISKDSPDTSIPLTNTPTPTTTPAPTTMINPPTATPTNPPATTNSPTPTPTSSSPTATPTPTGTTYATCCEISGQCNIYDGVSCSGTIYYGATQAEADGNCFANCY